MAGAPSRPAPGSGLCQHDAMTTPVSPSSLPWPTAAPVLPVATVRPLLERLESLARRHPADLALIPGLAQVDGEIAADPPPVLEQITDEFGGIAVHGRHDLDLLIEERGDIGPYTMLGEATAFYPLHEGSDVAVILTLDADGAPGAVYGIGEDLALRLAATDLPGYLQRYADALEAAVTGLDARVRELYGEKGAEDEELRADVAEQLLDDHLYREILGMQEQDPSAVVPLVPVDARSSEGGTTPAPEGALAVADLRGAEPGACVDVMDADLPGDPLGQRLVWQAGGLLVHVVES